MSNTMGIASAFVLSSLFLSPVVMAEESHAFVAHNAGIAQAFQQTQGEMTAKAQGAAQSPDAQAARPQSSSEKDS